METNDSVFVLINFECHSIDCYSRLCLVTSKRRRQRDLKRIPIGARIPAAKGNRHNISTLLPTKGFESFSSSFMSQLKKMQEYH